MFAEFELLTARVNYARFSRVYYSEAFQRELVHAINLKERTVRERAVLADGTQRMVLHIAPRVDLPPMLAGLVRGYRLGYEETTVFDAAGRRALSTVKTPGGDLLQVAAETTFSETAVGVRTQIALSVHVKILGLGPVIERFVVHETRRRYELVEQALQKYVDAGRDLEPRTP